jgi:CRP/FNR family cyclic AMP-dependent transcriptional regulator
MSIRIKVATTAKELKDVYRLRYGVYVETEGKFEDHKGDLIMDYFDAVPNVACVIAYEGDTPVGTMRVNQDTDIQLPADQVYDFSAYRAKAAEQAQSEGLPEPLFVSAGMLAIAKPWRNRRDVFRALFKLSCDVGFSWKATHIIATVSIQSASIYRRLGFESMEEKVWYEEAGEHIVPMASDLARVYQWAFGALADKEDLLERFSGCFEYLIVGVDSPIFDEGALGEEAYLISRGTVNISQQKSATGKSFSLATLGTGDMFGEMSLIDAQPRSASATATRNTELIVLSREIFWQKAQLDSDYLKSLLRLLSQRIRTIDEQAFIYAHGTVTERLNYFVDKVKSNALPSTKEPNERVAKITVSAFAFMASAGIDETEAFLTDLQTQNKLKISDKNLTFYGDKI